VTSLFGTIKNGLKLWKIYEKAVGILHKDGGKKMLDYVIKRLGEASTWRGIVAFVTALGVVLTPEQVNAIVAAGLALIGIIGVFTKDKGN